MSFGLHSQIRLQSKQFAFFLTNKRNKINQNVALNWF